MGEVEGRGEVGRWGAVWGRWKGGGEVGSSMGEVEGRGKR